MTAQGSRALLLALITLDDRLAVAARKEGFSVVDVP
jgi:hypothetical protein